MSILVDTHVHCYKHEDLPAILTYSAINMRQAFVGEVSTRVLFFTNSVLDNSWQYIEILANNSTTLADWKFNHGAGVILADHQQYGRIILAPARQVNTQERLELLLLGCSSAVQDNLPAAHYIDKYNRSCLVICPWGVGKWLGKRAKVLENLQSKYRDLFSLGDNGGRPWLWRCVSHFRNARKLGQALLNGSDPLPIDGEIKRSGSYGLIISSNVAPKESFYTLENTLNQISKAINDNDYQNFGAPMGIFDFVTKRIKLARR
jgi:hypothetical protein